MAQHTPGPWYTNPKPEAAQGLIYSETTGENIAVAYDPKNAHVIAAAPALLVAASDMMALADTLLTACVGSPVLAVLADKGISQTAIARIHAAGAAIAAAQGEG